MQVRLRTLLPLTLACSLAGASLSPRVGGPAFVAEARAADDTQRGKTLFAEGLALETGGNYAAALAKFQEVAQIKRTPAVIYHIAVCQEKLGQLVAALGGYRLAVAEGGDDKKNEKVVQAAQEALTSLEKKIPSLTIKRGKGADLAKVTLDGVEMGSSTLGKAQQVDPGPHSIEATQTGKKPFKEIVQLGEGEAKTVEITLKDAEDKSPPPPPSATTPSTSTTGAAIEPTAIKRSAVPYVVMGVGGASLIASGVFFFLRSGALSDLDKQENCINDVCRESAKSIHDRGKTMTLLGNVTLGLGVVGVGVGAVMLLTSKPKEKPAESAAASKRSVDLILHPGPGGGGASLVGSF